MNIKVKYQALEWKCRAYLKDVGLDRGRFLLAISGGADSMALLHVMARLRNELGLEIFVGHVHHGLMTHNDLELSNIERQGSSDGRGLQSQFRDGAHHFCQKKCVELKIPFYSNWNERVSSVALTSEEELRELRYYWLRHWKTSLRCDRILLAHHRDDLLETRLIRLIRGCGPDGIAGMHSDDGELLRPLLSLSRAEIESYLIVIGEEWLSDPSNGDQEPLRNWLRQKWLPELEKKRPGGIANLAMSLERLTEGLGAAASERFLADVWSSQGILRPRWLALSVFEQRLVLARYLHNCGVRSFTQGHLDEIIKRLRSTQIHLDFRIAGVRWVVGQDFVRVQNLADDQG